MDKTALGDRMKMFYEDRTRFYLPRRTYTILRLDQKAAHTYTKGLKRPFDQDYMRDMDFSIEEILSEIQGSKFAYTQSDECSILLTDFDNIQTDAWFDGNVQKITSVASSLITAHFNSKRLERYVNKLGSDKSPEKFQYNKRLAYFDCRVFTIPSRVEVMNYFRWRQQDCTRNSVSMVAQYHFSHKELQGKSQSDMHEMLHKKGVNWANDFSDGEKNGRIILKNVYEVPATEIYYTNNTELKVKRERWEASGAWVFSKDEGKLLNLIPKQEE